MLLPIPGLLTPDELSQAQVLLSTAQWTDGRPGAGSQAVLVKNNQQLAHDNPVATQLRSLVLGALNRNALFYSATLPRRIFPPRFNRYSGLTNSYGDHVDGAIRFLPATAQPMRTDISCTLFLTSPEEYEGGELIVHETHGDQRIKLTAGSLIVYPATHVHQVAPVTSGSREACFFWVESLVQRSDQRHLLFNLDKSIQALRSAQGDSEVTINLTSSYHNLLRMWASP